MSDNEEITVTAHRPVVVRLSAANWVVVIGAIFGVGAAQVWNTSRQVAETTAYIEKAMDKAVAASNRADEIDRRLEAFRDQQNSSLVRIASDIGEIKGQLIRARQP